MFDNEALDALASLSDALDAYMGARAFLSRPAAELSFSAFEGERSIACAGVAVLNATRSVRLIAEDWPGGFILKRHVAALDATIRSQFERWQWSDLLGADGLAIVQDRLDAYDEARRVPLLRAALTWRQRPDANPHDNGDRLATEAQHRGLAPMETPADEPIEAAESRTWTLYYEWRDGPVLGPVRPDFVQVESGTLSGAADGIQRFGRPLLEERRARRRERALALIAEARLATEAAPDPVHEGPVGTAPTASGPPVVRISKHGRKFIVVAGKRTYAPEPWMGIAYELVTRAGLDQTAAARKIESEFHFPCDQSKVSRAIKRFEVWHRL